MLLCTAMDETPNHSCYNRIFNTIFANDLVFCLLLLLLCDAVFPSIFPQISFFVVVAHLLQFEFYSCIFHHFCSFLQLKTSSPRKLYACIHSVHMKFIRIDSNQLNPSSRHHSITRCAFQRKMLAKKNKRHRQQTTTVRNAMSRENIDFT